MTGKLDDWMIGYWNTSLRAQSKAQLCALFNVYKQIFDLLCAKQFRVWIAASAFSLLAMTAVAQESTPSIYSPDFCEFSVTFPDQPYKTRRCEDGKREKCYDLVSYTQVYDLSSTVTFRVICNPIGEDVFKAYSPEVMAATLKAMTKNSVVEEFNTSFREEDGFKQAGLVGEGKTGRTSTIYIAQLWIGQQSALSVEAELIGEAYEDADALFSDVLKSVGLKEAPQDDNQEE